MAKVGEKTYIAPLCERVDVLMFVRVLTVVYFKEHLHTYIMEKKDDYEIVISKILQNVLPLD